MSPFIRVLACVSSMLASIVPLVAQVGGDLPTTLRWVAPRNIFEALASETPGEGAVMIIQPEQVRQLVGGVSSRYGSVLGREGNISLLQGFRIQFYNSNLPGAKAEAERRASEIKMQAPNHPCYISYNAPFWRLVVGDFLSSAEAKAVRSELLKLLPAWGRDSYVVKDKVRILNYESEGSGESYQ